MKKTKQNFLQAYFKHTLSILLMMLDIDNSSDLNLLPESTQPAKKCLQQLTESRARLHIESIDM